ncbi:alpha-1,2-mannosyltransferase ALG11 NDAI_0D01260 [Naumovozyma dairenensis CBS 421]|uniref:GDP-Man:Man(3)GlcNAc(2)-PP-Dol alpha-1,2-mannosyltransferase n=1 Tax=Naumovozyma dairenensis (strain ATCC 10597 / BCRC 20456 / CBS 421 / NBRC 0211 / NRRL Y-12639) TaxID=1071378 RepID=G0W9H9_NAUDC|nr:hypothetical protein NDAI_0D01260 [Naumovozyma dairenensis CBS 421]CCD24440.1 hypothetical protein NDAI_0D01260 [Naumovozyma dairenensis CBS 421]
MIPYLFFVIAVIGLPIIITRILCNFIRKKLFALPNDFKQQAGHIQTFSNVPSGLKQGSIRRSLILSSLNPNKFNNFRNQKLSSIITQSDKEELSKGKKRRYIYGFFHPYCNAGGGGEKVLWKAVEATLTDDSTNIVLIYTGDIDTDGATILRNVQEKFDYTLDSNRIVFIYLKYRTLVDDKTWPRFTLLGQGFGSIILSIEALFTCPPDVWCDTMGYPFGYPFVSFLLGIPIVTYTHYPIISTDMLKKLRKQPRTMKNLLKYYYWRIFMLSYQAIGKYVTVIVTNSTWTNNHIKQIWSDFPTTIIYPPCSTEKLVSYIETSRKNQCVVLAQFRPEKRHKLIIRSYHSFMNKHPDCKPLNLVFLGSTRSVIDKAYVKELTNLCFEELKIPKHLIEFKTDCPYEEIKAILNESTFGINAMWNEHFGIAVVEYLASGLIPLVHASAGPLLDIVVPWDIVGKKR